MRREISVAEENKENMRRVLEEAFGEGKVEIVDEVFHPDFVCWDPNSESGEIRGADTMKGEIEYFRSAVPDLTYTVEDQMVEGDKVVSRYTVSGTHQGEFFGVAGTGKRIEMTGINIDRFDDSGKLIEEWAEYDLLGAMRQMGAIAEAQQTGD
jgi:predicted ester cyclase